MRFSPRRTVAALVAGALASLAFATPAFADTPTAGDGSVAVSLSAATPIDLSDFVSGSPGSATYSIVPSTGPTTGTLSTPDSSGNTTFTPTDSSSAAGDSDTFEYQFDDGVDTPTTATITLTYNAPPTATAASFTVSPQHEQDVDLSSFASDPDSGPDSLTYSVVDQPTSGGNVVFSGSTAQFTPTGTPTGTTTFTYKVNDGLDDSNTATVTLTFNAVPTASADSFTVSPAHETDLPMSGDGADSDHGPSALTYSVVSQPTNGSGNVVFSGSTAQFTPSGNPTGTATFTYKVNDGLDDSNTATVNLSFNTVPVANPANFTVSPLHERDLQLSSYVSDPNNGQTLTYSVVSQPTNSSGSVGHVAFSGSTAQFTPSGNPSGTATFTYKVSDGIDTSSSAIVTLTIAGPAAQSGALNISPLTTTDIDLSQYASDGSGDQLSYSVGSLQSTNSNFGTLGQPNGSIVHFTPGSAPNGTATFQFQASDGQNTASGTVTLTYKVFATDAGPITISVQHNSSIPLAAYVGGGSGGPFTYSVVQGASQGLVTFPSGGSTALYKPVNNASGPDSFTYKVTDGNTTSLVRTVSLVFNHVPTASNDHSLSMPQRIAATSSTPIDLSAYTSDADAGATLTYNIINQPDDASVNFSANSAVATVVPDAGATGPDSFTYTVTDNYGDTSNVATAFIRYNDVPTLKPKSVTILQDMSANIDLGKLAADGDDPLSALTYQVKTKPGSGKAVIEDNELTYKPPRSFAGTATIGVTAWDGFDKSIPATVTVVVRQDTAPTAQAASAHTSFEKTVTGVLTATDPDTGLGDTLSYSIDGGAGNGRATVNPDGTYSYAPFSGFAGTDSFRFTAMDHLGLTSTAKVTIVVGKAASKITAVTFSPKAPTPGQSVTATVSISTKGSTATSIVVLKDGSKSYRDSFSGSTATVHLGTLSAGTHHLTVSYLGTSSAAAATTTATIKVAKVTTTMSVTSKPKQLSTKDRGVATIKVSAPHAVVDGALVTIKDGSTRLGESVVRNGTAKITLPKLKIGQHNLTVSYAGTTSATSVTKSWVVRVSLG